jgi:hypothetical protein
VPFQPAGLYWEAYRTCRTCPQKVWLLAAKVETTADAAAVVEGAAELQLPLGYPLVVHGGQIQLPEMHQESLLVIYGIVDTDGHAHALQGELKKRGVETTVIKAPYQDAGHGRQLVVRLQPGPGKVPAYRKEDLQVPGYGSLMELYWTDEAGKKTARERLAKATPACMVDRGAIFLPPRREIEWYRWVPVDCDGELAFVDWRETRVMSTYFSGATRRLRQVVLVECDSPTIYEWKLDARGRRTGKPREVLKNDGC